MVAPDQNRVPSDSNPSYIRINVDILVEYDNQQENCRYWNVVVVASFPRFCSGFISVLWRESAAPISFSITHSCRQTLYGSLLLSR